MMGRNFDLLLFTHWLEEATGAKWEVEYRLENLCAHFRCYQPESGITLLTPTMLKTEWFTDVTKKHAHIVADIWAREMAQP